MYAYIQYKEICQFTIIQNFIDSIFFPIDDIIILVKIQGCYFHGNTSVGTDCHYSEQLVVIPLLSHMHQLSVFKIIFAGTVSARNPT